MVPTVPVLKLDPESGLLLNLDVASILSGT
jgi:hypothetical protein